MLSNANCSRYFDVKLYSYFYNFNCLAILKLLSVLSLIKKNKTLNFKHQPRFLFLKHLSFLGNSCIRNII